MVENFKEYRDVCRSRIIVNDNYASHDHSCRPEKVSRGQHRDHLSQHGCVRVGEGVGQHLNSPTSRSRLHEVAGEATFILDHGRFFSDSHGLRSVT